MNQNLKESERGQGQSLERKAGLLARQAHCLLIKLIFNIVVVALEGDLVCCKVCLLLFEN